ncbi:MAG: cell division protein FtsQ [Hespellia sp.]|nr:cell division protein FtsQ [Hespellia sp.]
MKIHRSDYYIDEDDEVIERGKKRKHKILRVFMAIGAVIAAAAVFVLLFHTRKITVTGNEYSTQKEVQAWIQKDKLSYNTVYTWWKFNYTDAKQLPLVETMEITIKSPWEINARVYEKSIVGYLDFEGTHVYFDKDGVVVSRTTESIEGVPCIEGITVSQEKIVVHEELPVKKTTAFNNIFEVAQAMEMNKLSADRMSISDAGEVTLYMGNVAAALGSDNFADKVAQLPPIMEKLQQNYPDQAGTLHLESYSKAHSSISFTQE